MRFRCLDREQVLLWGFQGGFIPTARVSCHSRGHQIPPSTESQHNCSLFEVTRSNLCNKKITETVVQWISMFLSNWPIEQHIWHQHDPCVSRQCMQYTVIFRISQASHRQFRDSFCPQVLNIPQTWVYEWIEDYVCIPGIHKSCWWDILSLLSKR